MSWIKENPFAATVAVVTAVIGGGIIYYGTTQSAAYEESLDVYDSAITQQQQNNQLKLYPTAAAAEKKAEAIAAYKADVEVIQEKLKAYAPADLSDIAPNEFLARVQSATDKVTALAEENRMTLPDGFALGFERALSNPPQQSATGELSYQLGAIEWLVSQLAESGGTSLIALTREQTVAEGAKAPPANQPEAMAIDIAVSGPEPAIRDFIASLASSDTYFFRIGVLRLQNTAQRAPSRRKIDFVADEVEEDEPAEETPDFLLADAPAEDAEEEEEAPAATTQEAGERIITQVLGNEDVNAGLRLELLLFPQG